ncbi:hypothetical protein [Streptomyces sp. NPDC051997]|uniref:hypothetical protein n=1 Tax=Streptomyces sp. NPDC051997 TaxID=3155611 RepID=UPI00342CF763
MTQRKVIASSIETTPRGPVVTVIIDVGEKGIAPVRHIFPLDILEWRAAEYDIDHTAVDELLDIVLHEPYLTDDAPVYTAASAAEARAVHRERIAAVKAAGRGVGVGAAGQRSDPLQPIKDVYARFADAAEVEAKASHVDRHRAATHARTRRAAARWTRRPIPPIRPEPKEPSSA